MQVVRQAPDEPVKDPTLALLVRFLAQHPELAVIPKQPTAPEMLAFMNEIADIEPKPCQFRCQLTAYRWMRPDARPSSTVTRLMHFLKTALLMGRSGTHPVAGRLAQDSSPGSTQSGRGRRRCRDRTLDHAHSRQRRCPPPQAPCRLHRRRRRRDED
jgi:hypothetical protein